MELCIGRKWCFSADLRCSVKDGASALSLEEGSLKKSIRDSVPEVLHREEQKIDPSFFLAEPATLFSLEEVDITAEA